MAIGEKRMKSKWDTDTERQLIDSWVDILKSTVQNDTKRKKDAISTTRINIYLTEELDRTDQCTEKAVYNKIYMIMKKGNKYTSPIKRKERQERNTQQNTLTWTWRLQSWPGKILRPITFCE